MKNADDHTSVDIWVTELNLLEGDSPIILYKQQGADPTGDTSGPAAVDFLLGIQTITQRKFMTEFGNGCTVCLD